MATLPDYYLAEDPASRCKVRVVPSWDVMQSMIKVQVTIDDQVPTTHGKDTLAEELRLGIEFDRPATFQNMALELLRQHVISEAHADMSFVELASR